MLLVLDIKLARHNKVPVLVASPGLKVYNYGTMPATPGKMVYKEEDIDLTKVDFHYERMVDKLTAMEGYILHT